jgi:hypothetical protein
MPIPHRVDRPYEINFIRLGKDPRMMAPHLAKAD